MTPSPSSPDQESPGNGNNSGGEFASSVMKMVGATTVAQILALLVSPIVTRLYRPETYGVYAVFLSIIGTFVMVVCLRYELPIVLLRSERAGASLFWLSIVMAGLVSLVITPVMVFYGQEIEQLFNAPGPGCGGCWSPRCSLRPASSRP